MRAARSSGITGGAAYAACSPETSSWKSSIPSTPSGASAQIAARTDDDASSSARSATLAIGPSVTRNTASLSSRMYASLSSFVCGFTTTKTPPASSEPKIDTTVVSELSPKITTRSPRSRPRSESSDAKAAASSCTSA